MCQKKGVTCVVLARGSSQAIPRKNLALLGGEPLLARCLHTIMEAECFESVWVSTDDPATAACAVSCGAQVHNRSAYTATHSASSLVALQEFLQSHPEVSVVCLVQCTSPFLRKEYLIGGLRKMADGCDSAFTVTRSHRLRWSEGDHPVALNFSAEHRPRRQDWAGELYETGMFYFTRVNLLQQGLLQGGRIGLVEVPPEDSLDIDTPLDLSIAQHILDFHRQERSISKTSVRHNQNNGIINLMGKDLPESGILTNGQVPQTP